MNILEHFMNSETQLLIDNSMLKPWIFPIS